MFAIILLSIVSLSSALDPNDELLFLQYDYDDVSFSQARTFNLSLDGVFNNSLLTVGAFIILGIILFGKLWVHIACSGLISRARGEISFSCIA